MYKHSVSSMKLKIMSSSSSSAVAIEMELVRNRIRFIDYRIVLFLSWKVWLSMNAWISPIRARNDDISSAWPASVAHYLFIFRMENWLFGYLFFLTCQLIKLTLQQVSIKLLLNARGPISNGRGSDFK